MRAFILRWRWLSVAGLGLAVLAIIGCSRAMPPDPVPDLTAALDIRGGGGDVAQPGAADVAGGTGWGLLRGRFVLQGAAPAPGKLSTGGKDAPTCHPDGVPDKSLMVSAAHDNGIQNVLIFARRVSRVHESYEATAQDEVVFDQKDCLFLSPVTAMRVSQPLHIKNSDPIGHNTNISPPADQGANPLLPPNGETTYQFGRPQNAPVAVSCNIHPWMKAWIIPRTDPYFAVTDEAGQFEMALLPAGEEIEFQVWHERASGSGNELAVPGLTDARGRFKRTVPEDGQIDLEVLSVPPAAFGL